MKALSDALSKVEIKRGKGDVVVPLAGFYRREANFERRRQKFYAEMARYFGFENWYMPQQGRPAPASHGREGLATDLRSSRKSVLVRDANAAPLEHMIFNDLLDDADMAKEIATIRADAGFYYRHEMSLASISPLKSVDLLKEPSGSSGPTVLANTKLDAMRSIGDLRAGMAAEQYRLLERVIWNDEFTFFNDKGRADRKKLECVLCVLDRAAVHYDLLPFQDFVDRWPNAGGRMWWHSISLA